MSIPVAYTRAAIQTLLVAYLAIGSIQLAFASPVSLLPSVQDVDVDSDPPAGSDDFPASTIPESYRDGWANGSVACPPKPAQAPAHLLAGPRLTRGPPQLSH
ncbi:MAG: hypothetical protein ACFHX7_10330 [Pseudomonadota bacterium]